MTNHPADGCARVLELVHTLCACEDLTRLAEVAVDVARETLGAEAEVVVTRAGHELARSGRVVPDGATHRARASAAEVSVELTLTAPAADGLDEGVGVRAERWAQVFADQADRLNRLAAAQAAAHERQEIVTIVSHDLRTPLQSVGLGVDAMGMLIAGTPAAASTSSTLARMQRAVATMNRLLNELLDVSRIHDGALSVHLSSCDVTTLVVDIAEQHAPLAAARGLVFQTSAAGAGDLVCDATRLSQAISNLVTNALRHATRGPILLRASRGEDAVRFEVRDHGPGIPPEIRARLFDRLYQGGERGAQRGGLGLGLYIAKGIAVAHGGRIGVDSEVGRGSTFWIDVPIRERAPTVPRSRL